MLGKPVVVKASSTQCLTSSGAMPLPMRGGHVSVRRPRVHTDGNAQLDQSAGLFIQGAGFMTGIGQRIVRLV